MGSLEKRIIKTERQNTLLKEKVENMEKQMKKVLGLMSVAENKIVIFEEIKK